MTTSHPPHTPDVDGAGRRVVLTGADNFRDIGGYLTAAGKRIRHGLVFRSDALHRLTEHDHALLAPLALKLVCDFRASNESGAAQCRWSVRGAEFLPLPIEPGVNEARTLLEIRSAPHAETSRRAMLALYRSMPATNAPQYSTLFRRILDGRLPLVCHCSAGKDRTGLFIALLLTVLGTPYETVMRDYMLSNQYLAESQTMRHLTAAMQAFLLLEEANEAVVLPFLIVEPLYLDTAFSAIRAAHGTFDAYRERALGLSATDVNELQRLLLE